MSEPGILYPNGELLAVQCFIDDPINGRIPWDGVVLVGPSVGGSTEAKQDVEIGWLSTISGQLATTLPVLVTNTTPIAVTASFAVSDTTATGALNALNAAITLPITSCGGAVFQMAAGGTLSGTVSFEGSNDGGVTWAILFVAYNPGAVGLSPVNILWTQGNIFGLVLNLGILIYTNVVGLTHMRARVSVYNSGTSTGTLVATRNVPQIGQPPFSQGNAQWARLTDLDGITGVNVHTVQQSLYVGLRDIRGTSVDTSTGNATAGTQRVILATNQPAINTTVSGTVAISTTIINATVSGSVALTTTAINATVSGSVALTTTAINATVSGSIAITNTAFNSTISNIVSIVSTTLATEATLALISAVRGTEFGVSPAFALQVGGSSAIGGEFHAAVVVNSDPSSAAPAFAVRNIQGMAANGGGLPSQQHALGAYDGLNSVMRPVEIVTGTPIGTERGIVTKNIPSGTQTISAVSLPLPTGAATEASLAAINLDIGDATVDNPGANTVLDRLLRIERAINNNTKVVAKDDSEKKIIALLSKVIPPSPSLPLYSMRGIR